jgi:hypothetical protein
MNVQKLVAPLSLALAAIAGSGAISTHSTKVSERGLLVWPVGSLGGTICGNCQRPEPTAGTVEFFQGGQVVSVVKVGKAGRFIVKLRPGTYELRGSGTGISNSCAARRAVVVGGKSAPTIEVDCHFVGAAPG